MPKKKAQIGLPRPYGKYELLERIGDGGMAEIFLARLPGAAGFEKIVVIKRILPELAHREGAVEMFIAEAKLAAEIQHRNVVQVFELDELSDGEFFMVMEYVKGTDLRRLLTGSTKRSKRIPPWFSVHVICEALDALAYVHELMDDEGKPREIIHRDVSPSNIFISDIGAVKLGDFGIAKEQSSDALTLTGQLKGKIPYMAPEQITGRRIDQRIDVFSAGTVLWECLTQRRLFGGRPDYESMKIICEGQRRPPSCYAKDVPPELDDCVLDALMIDVGERTTTARDLQKQLLEIMPALHQNVTPLAVRRTVDVLLGRIESKSNPGFEAQSQSRTGHEPYDSHSGASSGVRVASGPDGDPSLQPKKKPPRRNPSFGPGDTELDLSFAVRDGDTSPEVEVDDLQLESPAQAISPPNPTRDLVGSDDDDRPDWLVSGQHMNKFSGFGEDPEAARWATYRSWGEEHRGSHPFWLRHSSGSELGPIDYEHAVRVIREEVRLQLGQIEISADHNNWIDLEKYAEMMGNEALTHTGEEEMPKGPIEGNLDHQSLTSVLSTLGWDAVSGVFVVRTGLSIRAARTELHIVEGRPVYVYSDKTELQLPQVLVEKRLLTESELPDLMHEGLRNNNTLDEIAVARMQSNVTSFHSTLMKERLIDLYRWRSGQFVFDAKTAPKQGVAFARSLLQMLPEMVYRSFDNHGLSTKLYDLMGLKLRPAKYFDHGLEAFGFNDRQREVAKKLAKGKKLSALLRSPKDERMTLTVAYILLESQLLLLPESR